MTSLGDLQLQKPQDVCALVMNSYEIDRIQTGQEQQSGFSALMKWMEKPVPGKDNNYNIIDTQKLDEFIDNRENPHQLAKPKYQNLISSLRSIYPKRIENNAREQEKRQLTTLENAIQKI